MAESFLLPSLSLKDLKGGFDLRGRAFAKNERLSRLGSELVTGLPTPGEGWPLPIAEEFREELNEATFARTLRVMIIGKVAGEGYLGAYVSGPLESIYFGGARIGHHRIVTFGPHAGSNSVAALFEQTRVTLFVETWGNRLN